jgi:hypothetical protein
MTLVKSPHCLDSIEGYPLAYYVPYGYQMHEGTVHTRPVSMNTLIFNGYQYPTVTRR